MKSSDSQSVEETSFEKKVGRPNSMTEDKLQQMLELYYSHPYSLRDLADMFGVSRMTIWRAVQTAKSFASG
ncbi:MAG TPA: helix-turn-helix domain-containing protein [Candidatus Bilamarchaeaceae archaeon]|nr:helix-turn-helix domain-containing protein [Candidatus Bilamarchaeaceae archaeon]